MAAGLRIVHAHLAARVASRREGNTTLAIATVAPASRLLRVTSAIVHATIVAMLVGNLAACSNSRKQNDTYARATDVQGQCCENLQGPGRDECLRGIVRVDDPAAARTSTNQETYSCVAEHFVCDPSTGRPTRDSAQAQHDCLEDLQ